MIIFHVIFRKCLAFIIQDIRAHKHAIETYLFMIDKCFRGHSHLPHHVANNAIMQRDE